MGGGRWQYPQIRVFFLLRKYVPCAFAMISTESFIWARVIRPPRPCRWNPPSADLITCTPHRFKDKPSGPVGRLPPHGNRSVAVETNSWALSLVGRDFDETTSKPTDPDTETPWVDRRQPSDGGSQKRGPGQRRMGSEGRAGCHGQRTARQSHPRRKRALEEGCLGTHSATCKELSTSI